MNRNAKWARWGSRRAFGVKKRKGIGNRKKRDDKECRDWIHRFVARCLVVPPRSNVERERGRGREKETKSGMVPKQRVPQGHGAGPDIPRRSPADRGRIEINSDKVKMGFLDWEVLTKGATQAWG